MITIGLDGSSTMTGYAVMAGPTEIIELGYLTPHKTTDPALERIWAMMDGLADLVKPYPGAQVIVEVPDGKVDTRRHGGGGAGLSVYGMAVGCLLAVVVLDPQVICVPVTPARWIPRDGVMEGGSGRYPISKRRRAAIAAAEFPRYAKAIEADTGFDLADAIGLAQYGFRTIEGGS